MTRSRQSKSERRRRFEQFEQRLLMSAEGIGLQAPDLNQLVEEIAPLVADITSGTSEHPGANTTGFDGSGQTIAIIDSGIAWDHAALGGGYGAGNKVVGGWDFAENDANPYDDGPAGFHGTHVAGIAAGNGDGFQGVASGADLVGLRVFNDQGVGKIEWVESALQWVRNNLDSFANPITTVNMSLGADWKTESASDWNVIADELDALKSEGVFISVAAGNDFEDDPSKTLSHPAAHESVVPVASHDAHDRLSDFSQRDDRVLVAPGENVQSTVPNHLFGTRKADQLLGASGTSMAAPYVAGASAVLRQAYAAMGYGEVDQDTLYQTFWDTSNQIYDALTQTTFRQLDLDAAIESIVDSVEQNRHVTQMGALHGGETIRGTLQQPGSTNQYRFSSHRSGQIELTFEATEQLDPTLEISLSSGQPVELQFEGERVYINVLAGQTYRMEVGSSSGTGHYQITTLFQESLAATELGVVDSIEVADSISGDQTFSLSASKSGPMAFGFATNSLFGSIEVYDANMQRLTSQQIDDGRVDFQFDVEKGEALFVLVKAHGEFELSIDNLVSVAGETLTIHGTGKADAFVVNDGVSLDVEVNGTQYSFQHTDLASIVIRGNSELDTLELNLGERYQRTVLRENRVDAFDGSRSLRGIGFGEIEVTGRGVLTVAGSQNGDTIHANYRSASIGQASGHGFDTVIADGKGGQNSLHFSGSEGRDILFSKDNYSALRDGQSRLIAINYHSLTVDGQGGWDIANLFGSSGADQITLGVDSLGLTDGQTSLSASGFERATAFAGSENNTVVFTDSRGNDRLLFADGTTQLLSDSIHLVAHDFAAVIASSSGGYDVAQIDGTFGSDQLSASRAKTKLHTSGVSVELNHFNRVNVVANFQGQDVAEIRGTAGNDQFIVDGNSASVIFDGGAIVRTVGFGDVSFAGGAGYDTSFLQGSAGSDVVDANSDKTVFRSGNARAVVREAESLQFDGNGGEDSVFLDDVETLDVIAALGDRAVAVFERHQIEAGNFDFLEASAVDGVIGTWDMQRVDFQSVLRGSWSKK